MIKKYLTALFFLGASLMASGQVRVGVGVRIPVHPKHASAGQKVEQEVRQLKKDLDLSDSQEKQVRSLLMERETYRKQGDKEAMRNLHFNERMQQLLTPEQFAKYKSLRQEKHKSSGQKAEKDSLPRTKWDDVYN